jgi:hypothetical protein
MSKKELKYLNFVGLKLPGPDQGHGIWRVDFA